MARLPALLLALIVSRLRAGPPRPRPSIPRPRQHTWWTITTGTVLLSKNATTPLPPASMSKLMTLNMLFESLADGRVTMETEFRRLGHAMRLWAARPCSCATGERVAVKDLMRGDRGQLGQRRLRGGGRSAEPEPRTGLRRFMNNRAKALGMDNSTLCKFQRAGRIRNQRMSVQDLATLAGPADRGVSRILPLFRAGDLRIRRPRPGQQEQPQPAAEAGHRRRRAEDRAHAGGGLWPRRIGASRATGGWFSSCHRASQFPAPARRRASGSSTGPFASSPRENWPRRAGSSDAPMSGWVKSDR